METAVGTTVKNHLHDGKINTFVVNRTPNALVLRILSRSLFLILVLASLPFLLKALIGLSSSPNAAHGSLNVEQLDFILDNFADEGLLKDNDKTLLVNSPVPNGFDNEMHVLMDSDSESKKLFVDESYHFVLTNGSIDVDFIDRILKINGILAFPLGPKPSDYAFREKANYRVVHMMRYGFLIVGLKKTGPAKRMEDSDASTKKKQLAKERKALEGLEDVHLEPPGKAWVKSRNYSSSIKYLPDVVGDSLEGYNRRVFISAGLAEENERVMEWFNRNYPTKNKKFETHSLVAAPEKHCDVSGWLCKNVREEDYVVMKAEAEVVEEMMVKKRAVGLVDELFLECKNEWWHSEKTMNGRAYWECLTLYGRLRDAGVAVHQWWD